MEAIPAQVRKALVDKFGSDLSDIFKNDPYSLCAVPGMDAEMIDKIVVRQGAYDSESEDRAYGHTLTFLHNLVSQGHCVAPISTVLSYLNRLDIHRFPYSRVNKSSVVGIDGDSVGLQTLMELESECVVMLADRLLPPSEEGRIGQLTKEVITDHLNEVREGLNIELTDMQSQGVYNALLNRVSIITGLPGTGKTTSLRMLIHVMNALQIRYSVAAPTGIAAKRVSMVTGAVAQTIHRLFLARKAGSKDREEVMENADYFGVRESSDKEVGDVQSVWTFNQTNPFPSDIIIFDEASMIDIHLLYRILDATRSTTHLVFVGDPAQLPSVGPGNVLRDLIESKRFPTIQLTEIFRQADTSDIVKASHDIFHGRYPDYSGSKQFRFVRARTEQEVRDAVLKISEKLHEAGKQYQVLAPCHAGKIGVTAFNEMLREVFNPQSEGVDERSMAGSVVRVRDRILVTKNDYNYSLFNGDIGKIMQFTTMQEGMKQVPAVEIAIYGDPVLHLTIPMTLASRILRLAYAMTVHKFQGLEHEVIVIPVMPSYAAQLQRNLYYTAITRAIEQVIIIGDPDSFARAIANTSGMGRYTRLRNLLEEV
jgi:exodeoxyribonuclease V alpha subunit